MLIDKLSYIFRLMAEDPNAAADELDAMAERLKAAAADLRAGPPRDPGGMGDRARVRVVGPDGALKQEVDSGA